MQYGETEGLSQIQSAMTFTGRQVDKSYLTSLCLQVGKSCLTSVFDPSGEGQWQQSQQILSLICTRKAVLGVRSDERLKHRWRDDSGGGLLPAVEGHSLEYDRTEKDSHVQQSLDSAKKFISPTTCSITTYRLNATALRHQPTVR